MSLFDITQDAHNFSTSLPKIFFKKFCIFLLFFMAIRHSMFYLNAGFINTEMGFDQSTFGIFLLPVTASFGCLFFFSRDKIQLEYKDFYRLLLIGALPFFINYMLHGEAFSLLHYSIYDWRQRPSFLILLPITLAIVFVHYVKKNLYRLLTITVIFYHCSNFFVTYYFSIFVIFSILQNINIFRKIQLSIFSPFIYLLSVFFVDYFHIPRINIFIELPMVFGYLGSIFLLTKAFDILFKSHINKSALIGINVFYFYLAQALAFSMLGKYLKNWPVLLGVLFVFVLSIYSSIYMKKFESKLFNDYSKFK